MSQHAMTPQERRAAIILSCAYFVRMYGIFVIIPVFILHSDQYVGATLVLAGIALGIHGLVQAFFHIPLGTLSDYIGPKRVIIGGLLVFALGSVVAAEAVTIYQVIAGRALQGAGAIAAAMTASVAHLGRESQRSKMMAITGIGVGAAFVLALVSATPLLEWFGGLSGLFWMTVGLSLVVIALVLGLPCGMNERTPIDNLRQSVIAKLRVAVAQLDLIRLYFGVLFLHAIMAANFLLIPKLLTERLGLPEGEHWMVYLVLLLGTFIVVFPTLAIGERKQRIKPIFLSALLLMSLGQILWTSQQLSGLFLFGLWLFFIGFNYLEACMPALISKHCAPTDRGSTMGVYATMMSIGIFIGASSSGVILDAWGAVGLQALTVGMLVLWLLMARSMQVPQPAST